MASYTSIPYSTIVAVSVVPAILYFLSVAFIVRIEAVKYDAGAEMDLTVDKGKLTSGGLVFVIPLAVMIWMLLVYLFTIRRLQSLANCPFHPLMMDQMFTLFNILRKQ